MQLFAAAQLKWAPQYQVSLEYSSSFSLGLDAGVYLGGFNRMDAVYGCVLNASSHLCLIYPDRTKTGMSDRR